MKGTILLNYNENTRQIEEEEKARFIRAFLEQCFEGTPDVASQVTTIWEVDAPLIAAQKIKLRGLLTTYGIIIKDNLDGELDIYLENEQVAKWNKPSYKLRRDPAQRDRKKQLFIEMSVDYWSVFEEKQEDNSG